MEKKKSTLSESFVVGMIALIFLIVGYQTALFVYRASVMKIASNRDEPDTVYVYQTIDNGRTIYSDSCFADTSRNPATTSSESVQSLTHRYSNHSAVAEAVRRTAPRSRVESFRFNPNIATQEEFQRLGFTEKQAQAIINYREKGGSYRRKEDFAKSFVVSDSIYRRLAPYIDIPLLDLNLADSAAFDALPGIGGWFASRMIEHRKALGGYSYKEQLLDIYNFTEDKYHALEDLITVSPENMTPYPLWTLPADSLKLHPYIKNHETARSIVLFRENTDKSEHNVQSLHSAGIITAETAARLSRCEIRSP